MTSPKFKLQNHGFLLDPRTEKMKETDHRFGASPTPRQVLQPNMDWSDFLPVVEFQHYYNADGSIFDNMSCATYAGCNNLEIIMARKFGVKKNFSDRFSAKMNGTTKNGNYFQSVANGFRHDGLVMEEDWDDASIIPPINFDKYFAPIPKKIIDKGKDFLKIYTINYDFLSGDQDEIIESLKFSPLEVAVNWNAVKTTGDGDLYYSTNPNNPFMHAVTLFKAVPGRYTEIFDHYEQSRKKVVWGYKYGYPIRYDIIKKPNMLSVEFVKTKTNSTIFALVADKKVFPIMDPTTFFQLSGETTFTFREIEDSELKKYEMMPKLFTLDGMFKVLKG